MGYLPYYKKFGKQEILDVKSLHPDIDYSKIFGQQHTDNAYNEALNTILRVDIIAKYLPKKIIRNDNCTICFFADGTKEIVRLSLDDVDDQEKAVLFCIMKHLTKENYGFFKKEIGKLIEEDVYKKQERETGIVNNLHIIQHALSTLK